MDDCFNCELLAMLNLVKADNAKPIKILAHSIGGTILANFCRHYNVEEFNVTQVALSAP